MHQQAGSVPGRSTLFRPAPVRHRAPGPRGHARYLITTPAPADAPSIWFTGAQVVGIKCGAVRFAAACGKRAGAGALHAHHAEAEWLSYLWLYELLDDSILWLGLSADHM